MAFGLVQRPIIPRGNSSAIVSGSDHSAIGIPTLAGSRVTRDGVERTWGVRGAGPEATAPGSRLRHVPRYAPAIEVEQLARRNAATWLGALVPDGSDVTVDVVRVHRKRHSTVHELVVTGEGASRRVFVKEALGRDRGDTVLRPRSISEQPLQAKSRLQAAALRDLARAVQVSTPAGVAAIDVLDCVDRFVVLDAAEGIELRDLVLAHVRWRRGSRRPLEDVFGASGRILRLFHDQVPRPAAPTALDRRADVVAKVTEFATYLESVVSASEQVRSTCERLNRQVVRHLPAELDTCARFGDFGLTNLLVSDAGVVTAIDTLAALRVPPLHDATYFVTGLTAVRPQVLLQGHAIAPSTIERWRRCFWDAYLAGRHAPEGAIATWTGLRLLERWSAKSTRTASAPARRGPGALVDRYLLHLLERAVAEAERAGAEPGRVNTLAGPG